MNFRRLSGLVLAGLLASSLSAISPTAAAAGDPSKDYPRIPRACATPQEKIPSKPVACRLNDFKANRPTVVLWGDSHAWMMIPALKKAVRNQDVNLLAFTMGSCPPMDARLPRNTGPACAQSNDLALRSVLKLDRGSQPLQVVLGGSWQRYHHALRVGDRRSYRGQQAAKFQADGPRLFRKLGKAKIGVDVIGPVATVPVNKPRCKRTEPYACDLPRGKALRNEGDVKRWLSRKVRPLAGQTQLVDVNSAFCSKRVCRGKQDGTFTFFDDLHLSATRSRLLRDFFLPTVARVLPDVPTPSEEPCILPTIGC